ncbi:ribose-phosphate pyrophosphokinase [Candidatus Saccharibacteria bacterium RIFCSPLOWO2_02_FULL_46_7]|nr:MAG: ribose-phosphate pyrophosphokinase [Candidatus Saccharibacteria bacterium RIFCSPLOWO2_02_FULL_46_7]
MGASSALTIPAHKKELHIISGSSHRELAGMVAKKLGTELSQVELTHFANGEIMCKLEESVRGADVFVFQSHFNPVNDAIIEQAIIIDACKRASAARITAVCPLFGYARQDRKSSGREPIAARLMIDILATAGANRIVSLNLHSGQIQGFFSGPFDHLTALPALAEHLKSKFGTDFVIVSPDTGRVKMAERYATYLGTDLALVHKRRVGKNVAEALDVIGDVKGKNCVIIDDMIDTAGTMCAAAEQLKKHGAAKISAVSSHGLFSPPAKERLDNSPINFIIVTDTVPQTLKFKNAKLEVVTVSDLLASAVKAIFEDSSVSAIFGGLNQI